MGRRLSRTVCRRLAYYQVAQGFNSSAAYEDTGA
jgi:hypothetical protein